MKNFLSNLKHLFDRNLAEDRARLTSEAKVLQATVDGLEVKVNAIRKHLVDLAEKGIHK